MTDKNETPADEIPEENLEETPETTETVETPAAPLTPDDLLSKPEPETPKESRMRKFARSALRWLVGLAVVFVLGVLAVYFVRVRPQNSEIEALETEVAVVSSANVALEGQVAAMDALETELTNAQHALEMRELQVSLVVTRADVEAARLALLDGDVDSAKVALADAPSALDAAALLIPADQADALDLIVQRLTLALETLEDGDLTAVDTDLMRVAENLNALENQIFARP